MEFRPDATPSPQFVRPSAPAGIVREHIARLRVGCIIQFTLVSRAFRPRSRSRARQPVESCRDLPHHTTRKLVPPKLSGRRSGLGSRVINRSRPSWGHSSPPGGSASTREFAPRPGRPPGQRPDPNKCTPFTQLVVPHGGSARPRAPEPIPRAGTRWAKWAGEPRDQNKCTPQDRPVSPGTRQSTVGGLEQQVREPSRHRCVVPPLAGAA